MTASALQSLDQLLASLRRDSQAWSHVSAIDTANELEALLPALRAALAPTWQPMEPVDAIMRMLRARAEDGQIEIADAGVAGFIEDALRRILTHARPAAPPETGTMSQPPDDLSISGQLSWFLARLGIDHVWERETLTLIRDRAAQLEQPQPDVAALIADLRALQQEWRDIADRFESALRSGFDHDSSIVYTEQIERLRQCADALTPILARAEQMQKPPLQIVDTLGPPSTSKLTGER